jgi:hypothetical protein
LIKARNAYDLRKSGLNDNAMAAPPSIADDRLERWRAGFEDMFALVAGRFAQVESRRRARMSVLGLLSGAERKNSWTIAEAAGDLTVERHWGCRRVGRIPGIVGADGFWCVPGRVRCWWAAAPCR